MCKHEHITMNEEMRSYNSYTREADGTWSNAQLAGESTGRVYVHCHDCGLAKEYLKWPKWVKRRFEETGPQF